MPHRNLLLPAQGAVQTSTGAELICTGPVGLKDDLLQAWLLVQRAQPQGMEPGLQDPIIPTQHPGRNIPSTGQRAISAWRLGRRF